MPKTDEFGGVAVSDEQDEFGGMPIPDEEAPNVPAPFELTRDAGPYGRVTLPQVIQTEFGPISNQPKTQSLEEARHETFANLKPTGREVQNAYDFARGLIPTLARGGSAEVAPDQPVSNAAKITAGVVGGGINLAEGFSTPTGVALAFAGGIPGFLGRAVNAGFLIDMLRQTPDVYKKLGDAFGRGDKTAEAEAVFDAVAHGAFTAGTAHGTFKGASPQSIRDWAKEFVAKTPPEEKAKIYNVEPTQAPVETRTQEVFNGKPVEILEVNKQKGTALVVPEGQPDAAPDVVPYGEIETREIPVEKGPNASSKSETAAVYGDVRARPVEGEGQVPTEEGRGGVQPQTGERVRQAEGENREVPLIESLREEYKKAVAENRGDDVRRLVKEMNGEIIKTRIAEGLKPEDVQVIVNKPGGEEAPQANYIQVDDVTAGKKNPFSSNPDQMNELGFKMPTKEELLKLPQGKYTLPEVQEMLRARETPPKYQATLFRGSGRVNRGGAYSEGIESPILGEGKYFATSKEEAANFGPEVTQENVNLSNPLYLRTDADYRKLIKEAGIRFAKFWQGPPDKVAEITREASRKLNEAIKKGGYDGVIVEGVDKPKNELLREAFGNDQVFVPETKANLQEAQPFNFKELTDAELKKEYDRAIAQYEGSDTPKFDSEWMAELKKEIDRRASSTNEAAPVGGSPAYAGFPLPNIAALGPAVKQALTNLNRTRKALQTIWKASPNRNRMDQTIDAADNKANIAGREMGNRLRIGTGRMERMATMAVVEANGDPKRLQQFEQQAIAGGNQEAIDAVRYAQNNWARLQADAARVSRILDGQIAAEQGAGIATEYRDAYVPHIYDRDLLMGSGRPFVIAGGTGMGSGFKKGRTFETIFDAIEQGYKPKTMDVADLVEHRVKVGQKIINRKQWAESLQTLTDPTDGNPIAAPLIRKSRGPGKPSYEVAPPGYRPMEILPGVRIGIHEAYLPLFRALTGESWVSGSVPGKLLLEAAGGIKHGLLVFDSFHASRIFQKLLTLAPGKVLSGKAGYKRGLSLLEYADSDLNAAVRENLITPEIATWVRANRANARMLIDNGLNVGRIQEGLYNSVIRQIPGIGPFNKWVFEKLTRGALMEAGLIELERVSAAKPNVPRETIAAEVSRNLNAYFGNLGRQGIFKSASSRDIARLVALAPQWVESMARTELKGAAQAVKGVTYDPIVHKTLLTGSIGKGVAQGLLAYFVGTQILNYITRGHSTFQNEEENHKLDAWIPGPKGSHGFFLSPFSVVAELTHDMLRYSSKEPSKWDAAMRIAGNKASPLTRALKVLMTGRDYDGKQISDTWNRVKAAGITLAPTPIPLAPVVKGSQYPGQLQRQLTASAGFKTEPAESAAQQVAHKAQQFLQSKGKKPVALELTDEPAFYKLRDAIRKDDDAGAKDILDALRKTHSDLKIFKAMQGHMSRPFTDSLVHEGEFRRSLSPQQQALYRRARDEQREEFQKFKELWYKRREK